MSKIICPDCKEESESGDWIVSQLGTAMTCPVCGLFIFNDEFYLILSGSSEKKTK